MVKINKLLSILSRVSLLILLVNTLLLADINLLKSITVKGDILNISFSKKINKKYINHFALMKPYREIYDFKNTRLMRKVIAFKLGKHIRMAQYRKNIVRVVISSSKIYKPKSYVSTSNAKEYHISLPKCMSFSKHRANNKKKNKKHKCKISCNAYGRKVIVIDAGHGGYDNGAVAGGKYEKDLVLQIAKRVERQLKIRGYAVCMTRRNDHFVKLHQRTQIADKKNSIAFISIHANSINKRMRNKVHGVETFFLQNAKDAKSQRVASRENKSVLKGTSRLSRNVIIDSVLTGPKIVESNKLAIDVQRHMMHQLRTKYRGVRDGGVRHAPFWVLVGASRPSILVEVGYISNPRERKRLFTASYQKLLAKGIVYGVDSYFKNRKKEIDIR